MCLAVLLFLLFPLEFSFTIQIQKRAMCSKGVRQKLARGAHFSRKLQSLQCIDLNMFLSLSLQLRWVEGYYAGRQTLRREIFFPQASSPLGSGWTNMSFLTTSILHNTQRPIPDIYFRKLVLNCSIYQVAKKVKPQKNDRGYKMLPKLV